MPCYSVVLLARNEPKSIATAKELRCVPDNPKIRYEIADLSCLEDILSLAENWQVRLHVLVNNAAETPCQRELTPQVKQVQEKIRGVDESAW
jgi:short-subunit dehydrogenase